MSEDQTIDADPTSISPWVLYAVVGTLVTVGAAFILFQSLAILSDSASQWFDCVSGESIAFASCSDVLTLSNDTLYGLNLGVVLSGALMGVLIGPVPVIIVLRQLEGNVVSAVLLLAVMIPYGLMAFFVLVGAAIVAIFFSLELTV